MITQVGNVFGSASDWLYGQFVATTPEDLLIQSRVPLKFRDEYRHAHRADYAACLARVDAAHDAQARPK